MAGSYNHVVNDKGNLLDNDEMMISAAMIENLGDAYEAIEEMYGMIWYLAGKHSDYATPAYIKVLVENARQNYEQGLRIAKEVNAT